MRRPKLGKDHWGALLLLGLGTALLVGGRNYAMGQLSHMGPGFIPLALGVAMVVVGLAIGITAAPAGQETTDHPLPGHGTHHGPEWRGWLCILGGVMSFVFVGSHGGLLPATFACVFISAMGDRTNTVKSAAVLAAGMTVFCLIVFHYGLTLQLPLFQWV